MGKKIKKILILLTMLFFIIITVLSSNKVLADDDDEREDDGEGSFRSESSEKDDSESSNSDDKEQSFYETKPPAPSVVSIPVIQYKKVLTKLEDTVLVTTKNVTKYDTDQDGIPDDSDKAPLVNDNLIVKDDNLNGIVDKYELNEFK